MDQSVSQFFSKNPDEAYATLYRLDHSPRIRALLDRYDLVSQLKNKAIVDIGGGQGFLGEMLDSSTDYWVIDGAEVPEAARLCKGHWLQFDLDFSPLQRYHLVKTVDENGKDGLAEESYTPLFDAAFCLETLEHLQSPYHCIDEIKKLVKPNGDIFISVPTETVWHNTPYPSLFWPPQNFAQWLHQMALPILDAYIYEPKERGWPAYQYRCRNADWTEAVMMYPKQESKFRGKKPHEYANL